MTSARAESGWIYLDEKMPEPYTSVIIEVQEGDGARGLCIASQHKRDRWYTEVYGSEVYPAPDARWHPLPPREEGE